ncbi:hypothetical protein QFC19_002997 [Naganishia cerealis]|uniref:Uncharacterized protein n=1 Tax=Naganishia cerealis TaxID=610337 RepID=A0ACC2W583_9TREE|nr:hypothetical protein QFC19_002997 [Naganishia cerealis]
MLAHDVEEYMNSQHASMIVESSDCDLLPDELFNDSRYSEDEVDRGTGAEGKDYEPDPSPNGDFAERSLFGAKREKGPSHD